MSPGEFLNLHPHQLTQPLRGEGWGLALSKAPWVNQQRGNPSLWEAPTGIHPSIPWPQFLIWKGWAIGRFLKDAAPLHICLGGTSPRLPSQCTWENRGALKTMNLTSHPTHIHILHMCALNIPQCTNPTHVCTQYPTPHTSYTHMCTPCPIPYTSYTHTRPTRVCTQYLTPHTSYTHVCTPCPIP